MTPVTPAPTPAPFHRAPPFALRRIGERWRWAAPVALALVAVLGALATIRRGELLFWDRAITDLCVSLRSAWIDHLALGISRLGSTPVVLAAGVVGALVAARRCRHVAAVMLLVVATRPPLEWLVKELVGRPRPAGARLVNGTGFSYPSGHVLAAAATWGFVPLIAGLYIHRRWLWWTISGLAWSLIALMAWSRVWLGVHWTTDVLASLLLSVVALAAAEVLIDRRHHADTPCHGSTRTTYEPRPTARRVATISPAATRRTIGA